MSAPSSSGPRRARVMPSLWRFGPDSAPILVRNAEAVLAYLPLFLGGWPLRFAGPDDGAGEAPDIDVVEHGGTVDVVIRATGRRSVCADATEAANALCDALVDAFVTRHAAMVCLRAGAALIGGGVAVLVGGPLVGKSSVALQLAAAGYRLFGDDRIAVDLVADGAAVALCLGLMPKVRLPLPPDGGARFTEFVAGYTEMQDDSAAWLKPWAGEAATFGETAPVGALVVLERVDGAADVALTPLPGPALLRSLIESATGARRDAGAPMALLERLTRAAPGYALRFGSSRAAASVLAGRLAPQP